MCPCWRFTDCQGTSWKGYWLSRVLCLPCLAPPFCPGFCILSTNVPVLERGKIPA